MYMYILRYMYVYIYKYIYTSSSFVFNGISQGLPRRHVFYSLFFDNELNQGTFNTTCHRKKKEKGKKEKSLTTSSTTAPLILPAIEKRKKGNNL